MYVLCLRAALIFADEGQSSDSLSLHAIYRFKIAQALPVGEERSFEDLSKTTGLNVVDLRRMLRHAMCNRIFRESRPGFVVHTAASKLLAENKLMYDFAGIGTEEKFLSAPRVSIFAFMISGGFTDGISQVVDALEKYGGAYDPRETGSTRQA